jgi:hypothetical protein
MDMLHAMTLAPKPTDPEPVDAWAQQAATILSNWANIEMMGFRLAGLSEVKVALRAVAGCGGHI